jgi:hypothetical protein
LTKDALKKNDLEQVEQLAKKEREQLKQREIDHEENRREYFSGFWVQERDRKEERAKERERYVNEKKERNRARKREREENGGIDSDNEKERVAEKKRAKKRWRN